MELVFLTVLLGLLFDYTNGFHDAANVVSTVIATRVLTPLSAIVMAAVLNTIGATQIVVLSAVCAAIFWNLVTWYFGMPSSSSYALIGGLLGSAWMHGGRET